MIFVHKFSSCSSSYLFNSLIFQIRNCLEGCKICSNIWISPGGVWGDSTLWKFGFQIKICRGKSILIFVSWWCICLIWLLSSRVNFFMKKRKRKGKDIIYSDFHVAKVIEFCYMFEGDDCWCISSITSLIIDGRSDHVITNPLPPCSITFISSKKSSKTGSPTSWNGASLACWLLRMSYQYTRLFVIQMQFLNNLASRLGNL